MNKKRQKTKKTKSLLKFLKNRKSVSVALGVCLAVVASAYVATAKFSAQVIDSGQLKGYECNGLAGISVRIVDKATGEGVSDKTAEVVNTSNKKYTYTDSRSGSQGYITADDYNIVLCKKGNNYYIMSRDVKDKYYKVGKLIGYMTDKDGKKTGKNVTLNLKGGVIKESDIGKYEKKSVTTYSGSFRVWLPTIILYSDGSGGKIAKVNTQSQNNVTINNFTDVFPVIVFNTVIDKGTNKEVSGKYVGSSLQECIDGRTCFLRAMKKGDQYRVYTSKDKSAKPVSALQFFLADSKGKKTGKAVSVTKYVSFSKISALEKLPKVPGAAAGIETRIIRVYLYSDGSGGYVEGFKPKSVASKVSTAVKTTVSKVTGSSSTTKVAAKALFTVNNRGDDVSIVIQGKKCSITCSLGTVTIDPDKGYPAQFEVAKSSLLSTSYSVYYKDVNGKKMAVSTIKFIKGGNTLKTIQVGTYRDLSQATKPIVVDLLSK